MTDPQTDQLQQLAFRIADSTARSDIETDCEMADEGREPVPGAHWYDTSAPIFAPWHPTDRDFIAEALQYLELRGLLIRDAAAPHIVSFREVPA